METIANLPDKFNVREICFDWFNGLIVGKEFSPEQCMKHIRLVTGGKCKTRDGTVTRYIRRYNKMGGNIRNSSRSKGLYVRENDHEVIA